MFYYFAFGSNLLKQRIQLKNPSAEFIGVGRLVDYALTFCGVSHTWGGSPATIVRKESHCVYGAIWRLADSDLPSLDAQESVPVLYTPLFVSVCLEADGELKHLTCRSYATVSHQVGRPSPHYLDIILRGAIQCNLPGTYIEQLRNIEHTAVFDNCTLYTEVLSLLDPRDRGSFQVKELMEYGFSKA
ncbi:AIG2-like family protein [Opisthorchis viverrini]|uniref:gamma-glutamylcyclotransferase n=1 Tax=Opisthorchis viverrini TaxID=6198 RepID=A0A1S8WPW0_OPIVI|nr:AIG2-like family protein [Opisthorchis viverrini]